MPLSLKMNINEKFAFLTSTRFIALVVGAIMFYLRAKGFIGESEMTLVNTILGGFVVIKTIDRNIGDAAISAAKATGSVTTVSMPSNVTTVTASTEDKG